MAYIIIVPARIIYYATTEKSPSERLLAVMRSLGAIAFPRLRRKRENMRLNYAEAFFILEYNPVTRLELRPFNLVMVFVGIGMCKL